MPPSAKVRIPNGADNPIRPSSARAGWDFLLHLEKYPGSHGAPLPRTPAAGIPPGSRARPRRQRGSCPGHANEKGPSFRRAPGRSGGEARIRTGGKGFAGLCLTTWPLRRRYEKGRFENRPDACDGADNGARTRDPNLGKVVLYQLSHVRLRGSILRDTRILCKNFF